MCDQQYAQSDQSLCWSLEYSMTMKLLIKQHLDFLSLKGGCTGSSESIHDKIQHCWKSHAAALLCCCALEASTADNVHLNQPAPVSSRPILFACKFKINLLVKAKMQQLTPADKILLRFRQ